MLSKVDFGIWNPEQKQVVKEKVPSKILSAAWSCDGSMLALGLLNGWYVHNMNYILFMSLFRLDA